MKLNQRTTLWGAILAVLLIFLALRLDVPPVVIVLLLVVGALTGLVVYSRRQQDDDADEGWDEGDEWGLQTDDAEDDMVNLDDRLAGLGLSDDRLEVEEVEEVEYDLFAADEDDGVVYEEEIVYEDEVVQPGVAVYGAAAVEEEPYVAEAPLTDEAFEEEFEGLVEEYEEVEEAEEAAVDYEHIDEASILAAEGVIDEEKVKSDEAILAASQASSLKYDDVLQREDANAETREILSRVASLLAKYE